MSVGIVPPGGGIEQVISQSDYNALLRAAQEHAILLKEVVANGEPNSYLDKIYAKRIGLCNEEAMAICCLEFRDEISVKYSAPESDIIVGGAFTIIYDKIKLYSPSNVVVDEFGINDIVELHHIENRGSLVIHTMAGCKLNVFSTDAVLRSIYYNILMRHPEGRIRGDTLQTLTEVLSRQSLSPVPNRSFPAVENQVRISQSEIPQQPAQQLVFTVGGNVAVQQQSSNLVDKRPKVVSARRVVLAACTYSGPSTMKDSNQNVHMISDLLCASGFTGEKVLLSEKNERAASTRQNIVKSLQWLVQGASPGDSFFFGYSGATSQSGGILPCDYTTTGEITSQEITSIISELPPMTKLTILFDINGGVVYPVQAGVTKSHVVLISGIGPSVVPSYCKSINYMSDLSALELREMMEKAGCSSPLITSSQPIQSTRCSLGAQHIEYVPLEGEDKEALLSYRKTDIGSWNPHR